MADPSKKTRIKQEASAIPVPQSRDEAVEAIAAIGRHQRERLRIEAAMNDELATVRQRHEEQALPHGETIKRLSQGVQIWCEANRKDLTQDGKVKTASLASGKVLWRMRPPKVVIRGIEMVMEALKLKKLKRFLRTKEEINKEAILAECPVTNGVIKMPEELASIKGLKVEQTEDFVIIPFETELEEVTV